MSNAAIFNYNGQVISRRENGFINLTQMCQANGKRLDHWKALKATDAYVKELQLNYPESRVVYSEEGVNGGTWGHPSLAINLARWISAAFAVWCDGHIFNLLSTGSTAIASQPPQQPAPQQLPQVTAIALAGLDAALGGIINPSLLAGVKLNAIAVLHPEANIALEEGRKILSHTTVSQGQLLTPTELGERLGISARKVNQLLIEKGLQVKNPDQHKGASAYLPTDKGLEFAEFTFATGRKGDNTSYQHIKWYPNVANLLNPQASTAA